MIAKLAIHKTKEATLPNAQKLKRTDFGIAEGVYQSIRIARRHLVALAKIKSTKF